MKENFATYEVSKQLKELGFAEYCMGSYYTENGEFNGLDFIPSDSWGISFEPNFIINKDKDYYVSAPLWQQVKQWLWEKHSRMRISIRRNQGEYFVGLYKEGMHYFTIEEAFDSPITAEIEGIKKAVEYLHKQLPK